MRVSKFIKKYSKRISYGIILKFISSMMDLTLPYIFALIIDDIIPQNNLKLIFFYCGIMFLSNLISIVTNIKGNTVGSDTSGLITLDLRNCLFAKILKLNCVKIDEVGSSSLNSRITSDCNNINVFMSRMLRFGLRAPILFLGGIVITLFLDVKLSLVMLAMMPFVVIVLIVVTQKSVPSFMANQKNLDDIVQIMQDDVSGIRIIKALTKEQDEIKKFKEINTRYANSIEKSNRIMAANNPLTTILLNIGLILVLLIGAIGVNDGTLKVGKIIAFMSYFTIILNALIGITRTFVMLSKANASAKRINEIFESVETESPNEKPQKNENVNSDVAISFCNVDFAYRNCKNCLNNINFVIKRGETLGITGETGSGKTTLINLMMRFYDVKSGAIEVFGKNVKDYSFADLRNMFGIAMQNDYLKSGTLKENVQFGRNLNDFSIQKAFDCSLLSEVASLSESKMEKPITANGGNLSGGQKQRVLIARALYGEPKILVLDDSSSALDYKTEFAVRNNINNNYSELTKVIVSQRISVLKASDKIIVLENGEVVGIGNHEQLLQSCEYYKFTCDLQSEE